MADTSLNDDVDARGIFGKTKAHGASGSVIGSLDSEDYSMKYGKIGKCLIFNHKIFEPQTRLNVRNGTDADAARLYCRFRELGFDVTLFTDLKCKEVERELSKVGKEDHSNYSCFVCCILSHGEQGILYGSDGHYKTEHVFSPFRGDACPSLAGKPKIFFIQACQGDRLDSGVNVKEKESADSGDEKRILRIPTHADFLIVYSTVAGFYSWRNTTNGSWFVQSLCATLQKYAYDVDLLQLLTIVNRRVAYDFESFTPHDADMHLKKQVPCITSTLTKNIRFSPP
ncbi:caspase-3-like isoform X2 [Argiope bruennichi]|nr:caspase-3-like isoform X2 [Argiope bruennichi]KAF8796291.1 Caspase like protein [Argiope bruennichi]